MVDKVAVLISKCFISYIKLSNQQQKLQYLIANLQQSKKITKGVISRNKQKMHQIAQ